MQVSIQWLKDYIDFDWTAEELADRFTMAGVPVENVIRADAGLESVVTGRIEKIERHPDSDHLWVCQMNVGKSDLIQIITGAQNVRQGQVVPVAMVGAHLPNGVHIKKGKLRGLPSNGMLCSAGELHLDTSKMTEDQLNGIYILPDDTPVGVSAKDVLGKSDVILEFALTATLLIPRSDAHLGGVLRRRHRLDGALEFLHHRIVHREVVVLLPEEVALDAAALGPVDELSR